MTVNWTLIEAFGNVECWVLNVELSAKPMWSYALCAMLNFECWVLNCRRSRCWIVQLGILESWLFIQFVTITQPLFNSLQCHVSPMLIVIFQFPFLLCRIIRVFNVILHTFNCHLLELIKILTLNLTGNELLDNCAILIAIKIGAYVWYILKHKLP